MSHKEVEHIDHPVNTSKLLERAKLELEIKQLKQSYFQKSILPILLQTGIGLGIAIISIWWAYRSNIFDAKEKSIDTKIKYDEMILKTYELAQRRDSINSEIKEVEIQKNKLVSDSIHIASRLDSMTNDLSQMVYKQATLQTNIYELNLNRTTLIKELGFAGINKNLQDLKLYPSPYYKISDDLISILKSNNPNRGRVLDSLIYYTRNYQYSIKDMAFYILYRGTSAESYRDGVFSGISSDLKCLDKKNSCLTNNFIELFTNSSWNTPDRIEIIKKLLANYNDKMPICGKINILYIISDFGYDGQFTFCHTNYNLYWDYLKLNRDLFTSSDSLIYEEDKKTALTNIAIYSPQLFFSLVIKYLGEESTVQLGLSTPTNAIFKSFLEIDKMPVTSYNQIWQFGNSNNLSDSSLDQKRFYLNYYNAHRAKIDNWLFGNFDKQRSDSIAFFKCVANKTF